MPQPCPHLAPEQFGQRFDVHQEAACGPESAGSIQGECASRHEVVNVRVVAQVARPGLQHTDHPDLPTQKARIGGELLQGRRRTPEEEGVDATLLLASELAKLGWEGEDHQEVGHRQAQFLLLGVPVLGLPMLTGRTVTIATRVIVVTGGGTVRTGVDMAA